MNNNLVQLHNKHFQTIKSLVMLGVFAELTHVL